MTTVSSLKPLFFFLLLPPLKNLINQPTMAAASTSEKRVLKLVHPGPFVEILKSPITAADVMEKNPRHCITRPDFFKFPWIVVSPESVLNPGEVFYVVPNRTIYHLQKTSRRSSTDQMSRRRETVHFSEELMMRGRSSHDEEQEHGRRRFRRRTIEGEGSSISSSTSTVNYGGRRRSSSLDNNNNYYYYEENYETRIRLFNAKEYYYSKIPETEDEEFHGKIEVSNRRVTELKSCLRKEGSVRKFQNLKVSFVLPNEHEEEEMQKKRCKESETEFSGFSSCSFLYDDDEDEDEDEDDFLCTTRNHVRM